MDDVFWLANRSCDHDVDEVLRDFESSDARRNVCFLPPLRLEMADQGTFLETFVTVSDTNVRWRLKNRNEGLVTQEFFTHKAWGSYEPATSKVGGVTATVSKIGKLCSDAGGQFVSWLNKKMEFKSLGYPKSVLSSATFKLWST